MINTRRDPERRAAAMDSSSMRRWRLIRLSKPVSTRSKAALIAALALASVVIALTAARLLLATGTNDANEAVLDPAVLMLAVVITWSVARIAAATQHPASRQHPVQTAATQPAEVNSVDLSHRSAEPTGQDEITQRSQATNDCLDRLELVLQRQRQFACDASHELRTPIAGLRVKLEEALRYPDDTDVPTVLEQALGDTERLEAIVTDLLLLARLGASDDLAAEPVDLGALVTRETAHRITRRHLHTDLQHGVIVHGVLPQLTRLLSNLLDNAHHHATSTVDIHLGREADHAVLTITDDGPGIPASDRERVFHKFTRLDTARSRHTGGTGLGLAIARDIAHSHHGTLTIHDSPQGACFVLRLPSIEQTPHPASRSDSQQSQPPTASRR